jgi:surface antigen
MIGRGQLYISLVAASLASAPVVAAVQGKATQASSASGGGCTEDQRQNARQRGRSIGGLLGGIARQMGGSVGGAAGMMTSLLPVDELLGEAIASMLDCREQQQAARATEEATRNATVGSTATWQSETRPGVTGSSTVTAVETNSPQGDCITVTDVIIVDGEETRAPKQMCRRPPSNRYVRV